MEIYQAIRRLPAKTKERVYLKIREKALLRTRARLIENRVDIEDLSDEELEVIIADEEDKLIGEYKSRGIVALLALLGISLF
ncbi:MAG: hypothetical protein GXO33_04515 [Epsilonproteobacteria bacterium]|nr:hypothetical protein [Campylobacterota bacterium]